jgi:hypothetical protein
MDQFSAAQWHDFFITVGGGAAALTGLVVVAMSLHLDVIAADPVLRHRARSILTALAAVFMRCSLALMGGQEGRAVGAELLVVCLPIAVAGIISYRQVSVSGREVPRTTILRTFGSLMCYTAEMIGAVVLIAGSVAGIYLAAVAMVANFFFMISGSWLLLVGVSTDEASAGTYSEDEAA